MKSQNFQFHLFGKIKSMHRLLLIILCLATNTYNYSQQPAFPTAYVAGAVNTCVTSTGAAGDEGLKTWCWDDLATEINALTSESFLSTVNNDLFISAHYFNETEGYNPLQVTNSRLNFKVDTNSPVPVGSGGSYNYRAEVRDAPDDVNHPAGTEQWWGFDYKFESDYIPDELNWIMWQTHSDGSNATAGVEIPMTSLQVSKTDYNGINARGEILVANRTITTNSPTTKFTPTGVVPVAGQTYNIVIHLVWGGETTGLYQVWIDGVNVYDETERTVYVEQPTGGYWKMGIYKWGWYNQSGVDTSATLGISELNTSIGALRVIKKASSNPTYMADEYDTVTDFASATSVSVTGITVTPSTYTLINGSTTQLTETISPTNATDQTGVWSSSNEAVATVSVTGLVTGLTEGTATIIFTSNDNSTISDAATVIVVDTFYGSYNFYNAETDIMIQEISGDESFDLNLIGDQINFRSIPQGGDNDSSVESVQVEWTGVENGNWSENNPIYAGMTNHTNFDFEPYTVVEGTYNFTVTYFSQNSGNGNVVSSDDFSITFTRGFTIDAGEDQSICEGSNDNITLTASQADSYLWSTGETTQSISVLPNETTTYNVTGTDSDGNESTDNVTVTVNPIPIAIAGGDLDICEDNSVGLSASGGDSYEWSTGETSQNISVSPLVTTTYTVTVASNGCSSSDNVIVTVKPRPAINAGNDVDIYLGESATLTAVSDGTFEWSTGETTESITVSPTENETYTVTATLNGCTSTDTITVTILNNQETVQADAGEDAIICEGENVTLIASGGANYLWSTGETTQSIEVSPSETTTYTVTVSNDTISDTDDVMVNVNAKPTANAGDDQSVLHGQAITLSASGGSEYIWNTGETTQQISVNPTENTTYSVEVIENGCSDNDSVAVNVNVEANIVDDTTVCQGSSTTLSASGGSNYIWSNGETSQSIDVSPSQTTTYTVIVSNGTSSDAASVTVNVNLLPNANAGEDVTIEAGQNITLSASGGNTYLWSTGDASQNISVSPTETSTYTVESIINGCSNFDEVTVNVVQLVNANAGVDVEICAGEDIILTASGGDFFEWNTGDTTASIIVKPSLTTMYSVRVSNGISIESAEVMVNVDNCLDSDNEEQFLGFDYKVYPNPSNGEVNIKLSGLENISSIYITDLLGKIIKTETFDANNGLAINKSYNLSALSKGIYFVTFRQSGEEAITKKLILK